MKSFNFNEIESPEELGIILKLVRIYNSQKARGVYSLSSLKNSYNAKYGTKLSESKINNLLGKSRFGNPDFVKSDEEHEVLNEYFEQKKAEFKSARFEEKEAESEVRSLNQLKRQKTGYKLLKWAMVIGMAFLFPMMLTATLTGLIGGLVGTLTTSIVSVSTLALAGGGAYVGNKLWGRVFESRVTRTQKKINELNEEEINENFEKAIDKSSKAERDLSKAKSLQNNFQFESYDFASEYMNIKQLENEKWDKFINQEIFDGSVLDVEALKAPGSIKSITDQNIENLREDEGSYERMKEYLSNQYESDLNDNKIFIESKYNLAHEIGVVRELERFKFDLFVSSIRDREIKYYRPGALAEREIVLKEIDLIDTREKCEAMEKFLHNEYYDKFKKYEINVSSKEDKIIAVDNMDELLPEKDKEEDKEKEEEKDKEKDKQIESFQEQKQAAITELIAKAKNVRSSMLSKQTNESAKELKKLIDKGIASEINKTKNGEELSECKTRLNNRIDELVENYHEDIFESQKKRLLELINDLSDKLSAVIKNQEELTAKLKEIIGVEITVNITINQINIAIKNILKAISVIGGKGFIFRDGTGVRKFYANPDSYINMKLKKLKSLDGKVITYSEIEEISGVELFKKVSSQQEEKQKVIIDKVKTKSGETIDVVDAEIEERN